MTTPTPACQPQCGTCKDIEKIETVKYRCKWNLCFIKPQDTCPCKPSHYSEAHHTSPPAPAQSGVWSADPKKGCKPCMNTECQYCAMKDINIKERDAQVAKAAREQYASELIEKIEKYLDEREQPKCVILSLQMVEKLIEKSLRAQQEQPGTKGGEHR